jgi:hypothetical protein
MNVSVTTQVCLEIQQIADYYETKLSCSKPFIVAYESFLKQLRSSPHVLSLVMECPNRPEIHYCQIPNFPYVIFYKVCASAVLIKGCFHACHTPNVWRERFCRDGG